MVLSVERGTFVKKPQREQAGDEWGRNTRTDPPPQRFRFDAVIEGRGGGHVSKSKQC
jgi:hypothetical protein